MGQVAAAKKKAEWEAKQKERQVKQDEWLEKQAEMKANLKEARRSITRPSRSVKEVDWTLPSDLKKVDWDAKSDNSEATASTAVTEVFFSSEEVQSQAAAQLAKNKEVFKL